MHQNQELPPFNDPATAHFSASLTVIPDSRMSRNAVLVSEEDWNAISETLHLMSIPGVGESIKEGMKTPVSECSEELDW